MASTDFHTHAEKVGARAVISVHGEIDVYTAAELREVLRRVVQEGARELVVDLRGSGFIDSTGLGVLVTGLKQVHQVGGKMFLRAIPEHAQEAFRITGLDQIFDIEPAGD